ncbi:hypothetical protein FE783_10130 [Paenibacillus mesophilus]|uniref:hypothetical protein n=1 Tax=Paenibacillus mesophilus TaxID=2582849 RepID=UPI00110D53B4|nr:hypothetical protein [Paenibacillus mesophilus]TMV49925.1 hypothetical protein FE783_10130 [Paenibacillus mesophilus]
MRKWMFGLVCGFILTLLTAAVPSSTIQGTLFPSMVTIHNGKDVEAIDVSGDNGVINYNNKAYIPLRLFSEKMGASVGYEPGSEATNWAHKIDIYQGKPVIEWRLMRVGVLVSNCAPGVPFFISPGGAYENDRAFYAQIHNNMKEDISVSPIELTFQVRAGHEVVYSHKLPPFSGVIPSSFAYVASFTWDHTGMDGKEVPPGDYFIELVRPSTVNYQVLDNNEQKTVKIERRGGCNLGYYGVTFK